MKIISLLQPYATLIAIGAKRIETRSWSTNYRGPLAIHASKRITLEAEKLCLNYPFSSFLEQLGDVHYDGDIPLSRLVPCGAIIATCNLVDVKRIAKENAPWEPELSFGDYTPGRFAWILEDVKPLPKPIPAKGQLGLWEYELGEVANGNII